MISTKDFSSLQEKQIAKYLNGNVTVASGGTKFNAGDVIVPLDDKTMLIEAKTSMSEKASFSVKKDWLDKLKEQSFEVGCSHSALAFRFNPYGDDYFILTKQQFIEYVEMLKGE